MHKSMGAHFSLEPPYFPEVKKGRPAADLRPTDNETGMVSCAGSNDATEGREGAARGGRLNTFTLIGFTSHTHIFYPLLN